MGVFDKFREEDIEEAEGFSKTPNMNEPGRFRVRVRRIVCSTSKRNENVTKYVMEYEIRKTASLKHVKGAHRSFVLMLDRGDKSRFKSKLGAMKANLAAIAGIDQTEIDKSFLEDVERNPLRYEGVELDLEVCEQIDLDTGGPVTSATKRPFTPQNWYPVEAEEALDEDVAF